MSDGYHIGLLIMSALYHIAPEFLRENRLCWLRSPLYIVENKGKETYFFDDEEYNKAKDSIIGTVHRNKGLGSLTPEQARNSMFNPENQRLDTLVPTDEALELLEDLMGDNAMLRKKYIFEKLDFSEIKE